MFNRLPVPALLACSFIVLAACGSPPPSGGTNEPYIDEWQTIGAGPADGISLLSIGNVDTGDNFINRGDVEVIYAEGTNEITFEMQRFTSATSRDRAQDAFDRMEFWGYSLATAVPPNQASPSDQCFADGNSSCYVRLYYVGQDQPARTGANFRVTVPAGWDGDLRIVTSDNTIDFPQRSNVTVDGLAGNLEVALDSGNVNVRVDPSIDHFAGCAASDQCEEDGFPPAPDCTCDTPTSITIENNEGQASNITVDVPEDRWYNVILENQGNFSAGSDFVCNATIDCDDIGECDINPDFANVVWHERAEINYPGDPALNGNGINVFVVSSACADIETVEFDNWDADPYPEEKHGDLRLCSGCL